MPAFTFNTGSVQDLCEVPEVRHATQAQIKDEPMLFQCSARFAWERGGPLTRACLVGFDKDTPLRIDTRSHMLMPGWYPCIPGWHCDFKQVGAHGEQVMNPFVDALVTHYMCVSGGPPTEFLLDREVSVSVGALYWGSVDLLLQERDELRAVRVTPGRMVAFDANEIHRGTPHEGAPGHWRFFFRATEFPEGDSRRGVCADEIRKQVQVYCDVHAGW